MENEKTNFKLKKEINEDYTSQVISSKIKEIHKSKNFFQFENQKSISIKSDRWLKYNDLDDFIRNINEKRSDNVEKEFLINHGFPVTLEEEEMIVSKFKENLSLDSLEQYFQRSRKTISVILSSYGYKV